MVNGRKQASGHRIAGIDILRISLAFLIYLFHSRIHVLCDYGFFNDFIQSGSLAMSGFFMLSGYSLQLAYGQKNLSTKDNIIDFYLRRFISIYPLYIVTGTLFVLMNIVVGKQTVLDNILLFPVELSCLQAMFSGSLFEFAHNSGTWFISCLAICYTIFPLIHILLSNTSKNTQILFLSLSLLLIMYSPYIANKFCEDDLYTNPLFRTMEFVIGALISQINISGLEENI